MARYTVVQIVDKCLKCRGCMVACERVNKLDPASGSSPGDAEAVSKDDLVVLKSQNVRPDMGPFVRYNCWHCPNPPCAAACPWGAIYERQDSNGDVLGVDIDFDSCHYGASGTLSAHDGTTKYGVCTQQCQKQCGRGGYPKFGSNSMDAPIGTKVYKCTLCATRRASSGADHLDEPACVTACPNGALRYGKIDGSSLTLLDTGASATPFDRGSVNFSLYPHKESTGGFFWISKKVFIPPTSDPFVEDHLTPMISRFMLSPAGMSFLMPAAIVGGLYGLIKRRMTLQNV